MTSAIDNRTTELLKDYAFALRRLEYDVDKPGSNMTLGEYEAEEKRVTDEYAQALAATLGSERHVETCENIREKFGYKRLFVCSECGVTFDPDCEINYCPWCGREVVDNADK